MNSRPIIFQGSGGSVGDIFLSSAPLYQFKKKTGTPIEIAISKSLKPELKLIYKNHKFIDKIHEVDSVEEASFIAYCTENNSHAGLYLKTLRHYKYHEFTYLDEWLHVDEEPTIDTTKCIAIQWSSSSWERPQIEWGVDFIKNILSSGLFPLFIGGNQTEKDLFIRHYPETLNLGIPEQYWRFGTDTILQTIANLRNCYAVTSIMSWAVVVGSLLGVPALDLWDLRGYHINSPFVRQNLGNPLHYLQDLYTTRPHYLLIDKIFPYLRESSKEIYGESEYDGQYKETTGCMDYHVTNSDGDELFFSELHIHLIKAHHFFEGHTKYRLDPEKCIKFLGIK